MTDSTPATAAGITQGYAWNKAWRERHPDRRHRWKTDYRARTGSGTGPRLREPWTSDEDAAVIAHAVPDRDLAEQLGRSVQAIAMRRWRLNKRGHAAFAVAGLTPEPARSVQRD